MCIPHKPRDNRSVAHSVCLFAVGSLAGICFSGLVCSLAFFGHCWLLALGSHSKINWKCKAIQVSPHGIAPHRVKPFLSACPSMPFWLLCLYTVVSQGAFILLGSVVPCTSHPLAKVVPPEECILPTFWGFGWFRGNVKASRSGKENCQCY